MIKVSEKKSDEDEYILDPQFTDSPTKKNIYFRETTGLTCGANNFWCQYEILPANASANAFEAAPLGVFIPPQTCQFPKSNLLKNEIESINELEQYGGGEPLPFQNNDPKKLRSQILKSQWNGLKEYLEKETKGAESILKKQNQSENNAILNQENSLKDLIKKNKEALSQIPKEMLN